jgi:hypothetical protein
VFAIIDEDDSIESNSARSLVWNSIGILILIAICGRILVHFWLMFKLLTQKDRSRQVVISEQAWAMFTPELKEAFGIAFSGEHAHNEGSIIVPNGSLHKYLSPNHSHEILNAINQTHTQGPPTAIQSTDQGLHPGDFVGRGVNGGELHAPSPHRTQQSNNMQLL